MMKKYIQILFLCSNIVSCSMQVHHAAPLLRSDLQERSGGGYQLDLSESLNFSKGRLEYTIRFLIGDQAVTNSLGYHPANDDIAPYSTFALPGGGTLYVTGTYEKPEFHYVGGSKTKEVTICARARDSIGLRSGEGCQTATFTSETNLISSLYTVGGVVAGLNGTLVLQNNGGDHLTINGNGSFTFDTALIRNASYDVSVFSAPWNQNCSVTHGTGAISTSNITNVVVTCASKSWTHPATAIDHVSVSGGNTTDFPRVAMDSSGNAIVVWNQDNSGGSGAGDIYMAEYRNGEWSGPSLLADFISVVGSNGIFPNVAMDDSGNAIIVWIGFDGAEYQIFKSEYRNGAWTHPVGMADNISPAGSIIFNEPKVVMDNNGNAIIVWSQMDSGGSFQILKSEYRSGAWVHPASIDDNVSPDTTHAVEPQVAMDDNGNAVIVWNQDDGSGNFQIFKSEYRSGTWTHPTNLADNISPDGTANMYPNVAMDDNGNAVIVWNQDDGSGNFQIYKSEYRSGAWTHPANLADNISPDGTQATLPMVAMDNNGNSIIIWSQDDGISLQGYKSEYRSGAWTHPSNLADNFTPDGSACWALGVSMNNHDEAVIVGSMPDGAQIRTYKSEYRSGAWTHPANISDGINPGITDMYLGGVAISDNGDAVIAMSLYDWIANQQVYISHYK